jgi:hypothetical protein
VAKLETLSRRQAGRWLAGLTHAPLLASAAQAQQPVAAGERLPERVRLMGYQVG